MIYMPNNSPMSREFADAFKHYYEACLEFERTRGAIINEIQCKRPWEYAMAMFCFPPGYSDTILDLGCGNSNFMLVVSRYAARIHGIDNGSWQWTREWIPTLDTLDPFKEGKIKLELGNAELLPWEDEYFDMVYTFSFLEHLGDEAELSCVREVSRVLKPGGIFCGTVDFNPKYEMPKEGTRVYTSKSFIERIVNTCGLIPCDDLNFTAGEDEPKYIAIPMFFALRKES